MGVTLWNDYKNYSEIIRLEYGKLSKEQIEENKKKWDDAGDFTVAVSTDSIFSPYEKKQEKKEWDLLSIDYKNTKEEADYYWKDNPPIEVQNFVKAYTDLHKYLFITPDSKGKPLLANDNMENASTIVKSEYDNVFMQFYESYKNVSKLISQKSKDLADEAIDLIDGVKDNVVYAVQVLSSNGSFFRNGHGETTLSATVFHGSEDITAALDVSRFTWRRVSTDPDSDIIWNQTKGKGKKTLDINTEDVRNRATFFCDVMTDGL